MKRKTRNILIIVGLIFTLVFGLLCFGAYKVYSFFNNLGVRDEASFAEELREPRVLKGADFLAKKEIFKKEHPGFISTVIKSLQITDQKEKQRVSSSEIAKSIFNYADAKVCGKEVVFAGEFGAYYFSEDGSLLRQITFEPSKIEVVIGGYKTDIYKVNADNLKIVDLDNDNKCEFIARELTQGVTVFNNQGDIVWEYGKETVDTKELSKNDQERQEDFEKGLFVTGFTVGDLDGDGKAEYIVARKNDGIRAFNQSGQEIWFQPEKESRGDLAVADLDADGKNEILEIGKTFKVRDAGGKIIRNNEKSKLDKDFFIAEDKNKRKVVQSISIYRNKLELVNETDNIFEADAPLSDVKLKEPRKTDVPFNPELSYTFESDSVYATKALWVALQKDKPRYLAVVASFGSLPRANFYVYAPDGNLVYQELLPENAETITAIPSANQTEEIIIGGKDTIWKFTAK